MTINDTVAVIGGGIAGLTAAAALAAGGKSVTLYEKSGRLGGRGSTKESNGFYFNMGPHSLYLDEEITAILRELGVSYTGAPPDRAAQEIEYEGVIDRFPGSGPAIMQNGILSDASKKELAGLLPQFRRMDWASWQGKSVTEWLDAVPVVEPHTRLMLEAIMRLGVYSADADVVDAGFFLRLIGTLPDVWYLDRGWGTLIDGLADAARKAGAAIVRDAKVSGLETTADGFRIAWGDGARSEARHVVLATDPKTASRLFADGTNEAALSRWDEPAKPIYAAAWNIALKRLPNPERVFVLGLDRPYYYSVHSDAAAVAPEGGALVYLMKYRKTDEPNAPADTRRELEDWLDLLQPGWRDEVIEQQFLPHVPVSTDVVQARRRGLAGRPGPEAAGIPNLYLAGDWVGPEGQLANASLLSGYRAAKTILRSATD